MSQAFQKGTTGQPEHHDRLGCLGLGIVPKRCLGLPRSLFLCCVCFGAPGSPPPKRRSELNRQAPPVTHPNHLRMRLEPCHICNSLDYGGHWWLPRKDPQSKGSILLWWSLELREKSLQVNSRNSTCGNLSELWSCVVGCIPKTKVTSICGPPTKQHVDVLSSYIYIYVRQHVCGTKHKDMHYLVCGGPISFKFRLLTQEVM